MLLNLVWVPRKRSLPLLHPQLLRRHEGPPLPRLSPNVALADEIPLDIYSHLSGDEIEPAWTYEHGIGKTPKGLCMVSGL